MDKAKVIERLELLTDLIDRTEPDIPSDKALFSHHIIQNQENIRYLIIDEKSMIGRTMLSWIDKRLRDINSN